VSVGFQYKKALSVERVSLSGKRGCLAQWGSAVVASTVAAAPSDASSRNACAKST
jgi:hypothetical protein